MLQLFEYQNKMNTDSMSISEIYNDNVQNVSHKPFSNFYLKMHDHNHQWRIHVLWYGEGFREGTPFPKARAKGLSWSIQNVTGCSTELYIVATRKGTFGAYLCPDLQNVLPVRTEGITCDFLVSGHKCVPNVPFRDTRTLRSKPGVRDYPCQTGTFGQHVLDAQEL